MRPSVLALATLLAASSLARSAGAQSNYRTAPLGGHSTLMGGTGIAIGRDGAAAFLNPATITDIRDTGFAFSAAFLSIKTLSIKNFHKPGSVDQAEFGDISLDGTRFTTTKVDLLPSTLCLFVNLSDAKALNLTHHRLSLCFGTLEREDTSNLAIGYRGGSSAARVEQGQSFLNSWNRFAAGPAYSGKLSDSLAIGISTYAIASNLDSLWSGNTSIYSTTGRFLAVSVHNVASALSLDINSSLGLTYQVNRTYTLGLTATLPTFHVLGSYASLYQTQYSGGTDYAFARRGEGGFRASMPAKIGAGLAAHLPRTHIELNTTFYFPRRQATESTFSKVEELTALSGQPAVERSFRATYTTDLQPVVNTAFGFEYFMRPRLGLLGGTSTSFTSSPPLSTRPEIGTTAFSRENRLTGSVGFSSYGDSTELVIGVEVSHGWGKTYVLNPFELPNRFVPIDHSSWGFLLVVAGATNLRSLRATVRNVEEAVKVTPAAGPPKPGPPKPGP